MTLPLTVLDTQWPGHIPALAPAIEEMGYHRYWATEHHSSWQSASPMLMAALAGSVTETLRVGTAGVMLRIASVARVVEDRAALTLFYPDRFDLGIVGALPDAACVERYREDAIIADGDIYVARVRRLVAEVRARDPRGEIWLCGKSASVAELAGELGIRFAFHHYLAGSPSDGDLAPAEAYRRAFVPAPGLDTPWMAIAAYGACAADETAARVEWEARFAGQAAPRPSFFGTPDQCATTITSLARRYGAREIALDCFASSLAARLDGLGAIARALGHVGGPNAGQLAVAGRPPSVMDDSSAA
jgi:alkanesulfonate monooxygenase SsuD/methylene tetrahydromethanopterin reductase-like flavin-dependent oxidoreductase (luciferase family)